MTFEPIAWKGPQPQAADVDALVAAAQISDLRTARGLAAAQERREADAAWRARVAASWTRGADALARARAQAGPVTLVTEDAEGGVILFRRPPDTLQRILGHVTRELRLVDVRWSAS